MSVRARTAIAAAAVFTVVFAVASIVGVRLLRSSLIDEIDRSNEARAQDIAIQTADEELVPFVAAGLEPSTAAAIVDIDGDVLSSTDVLDGTFLVDLFVEHEGPFDVSFDDLETVSGANSMRGVTVFVEESDEFLETFVFVASSTASVDRTIDDATLGIVIAAPALILLVGLLVWIVAGRALRPVARIRSEVEDITGSDLHRRVPEPGTKGEIGALAITMNAMLERLEQSSEQQRRFAADASHELRSPLASIAAQLDVDIAHPDTAVWSETARSLRRETRRMQTLVDDLLVLARSNVSSADEARASVSLDDIVSDAIASCATPAGVELRTTDMARVDIDGNPSQLARLATNLLSNAARHARSSVDVTLRAGPDAVTLIVDDDGPGIDPEDRERVFERFVRLDEARARDAGGSGLGLALCREICHAHGGTITVETGALGGARFTAVLPRQIPVAGTSDHS